MIVVAEPTHADDEHAAVNAAMLRAVTLACGPVVFAATPEHQAAIEEAVGTLPHVRGEEIEVLPPGGVHLRRIRAQWSVLSGLVRRHGPRTLLLLSAGPETLFVARLLVARFSRLRVFVVMHGNLSTVVGWRSRDPRRRLIDLRSGLRVARHPRIRPIVLEAHIAEAARSAGLDNPFLVWPLPTDGHEQEAARAWTPGERLRLTFVGTANRNKGFGDILALSRAVGAAYDWSLAGTLSQELRTEALGTFVVPPGRLSRPQFLAEVRRADYAIMSFGPEYRFIASASLMDCIAQRKPLIAVTNTLLAGLESRYGRFGYLCPDRAGMAALLAEPARLRDAVAYAGFQAALDAIQADRLPARLSTIMARDMAC